MNISKNPDKTPVAHDVFTWCTKEKTETWHVVRNHNRHGLVERVVCKACGSEHKYRPAKAAAAAPVASRNVIVRSANPRPSASTASSYTAKAAPAPQKGVAQASSEGSLETTWFSGLKKWGEKPVRSFDATITFDVGEVLEHGVFGKGIVQTRRENRIDVLFKSGLKTLPSSKGL